MSRTSCFDEFLKSLSKAALTGLRAALVAVKAQLEVDRAKALAKQLTVGNLKKMAKNAAASVGRSALQQVKDSMDNFNMATFRGCPTVDGIRRVTVAAVDSSVGATDDADYNARQLEIVEEELKKEKTKLDAQSRFLETQIAELDAEIAQKQ